MVINGGGSVIITKLRRSVEETTLATVKDGDGLRLDSLVCFIVLALFTSSRAASGGNSFDGIFLRCYQYGVRGGVHGRVRAVVGRADSSGAELDFLERGTAGGAGSNLDSPHSSAIFGSRHGHMRELRIQHAGHPYRVLYAFDPHRVAILLIGGDKTGDDRWYARMIPMADDLYDQHLRELQRGG